MKKVILLGVMCLMTLLLNAQRCAVLEFKAGVGISQDDVDGISAIFITYFRPAGYALVERTQIDKVIEEQGFQRSRMTQSQMVRVGEILNVSKIVVGDVNLLFGQYQVDARVINVETGTITATEGATFATSSYRTSMQSVAAKLAGKIAIKAGSTVPAPITTKAGSTVPAPITTSPSQPAPKASEPAVLHGYLKVFPNDLGTFDSEPTTVIANINKSQRFGYGTWRLPTKEELNLMRANNLISGDGYMASDGNRSGKVRLVTDKQKGEVLPVVPAGYVDLGLPSGTLWKDKNEDGGFYTYDQAMAKFGSKLPTKEQLEELKSSCQWSWTGKGYKVVGPSGKSIVLPALGCRYCLGNVDNVGSNGFYWSSTPRGSEDAWYLVFYSGYVGVGDYHRCYGRSVRLVQD